MKFRKNKIVTVVERYNPPVDYGLTDKQGEERKQTGNTNATEKKYSKSILGILFENVVTLFNLL